MTGESTWPKRLAALTVAAVAGFVLLAVTDHDPEPLRWALVVSAVFAVCWLVLDTLATGGAEWDRDPGWMVDPDEEEPDATQRLLTSHFEARDPGPTLRDRLLALARGRDPHPDPTAPAAGLPEGRLTPADVDRHLSRLEELRDRS